MTAHITLGDWLNTVTGPFPADTAARLREEFTAHHAQAVAELTRLGEPDPQAAALRELGDPQAVIREVERGHYTLADLAWLGRDQEVQRLLDDPTALQVRPWTWKSIPSLLVGTLIGTYFITGLPGLPSPVPLFADRTFQPHIPVLLVLLSGLGWLGELLIAARPTRSAAVLRRVWEVVSWPVSFLLFFPVAISGQIPFPEFLAQAWWLPFPLLAWAYLRHPQEALSLLPKALRNAR